MLSSEQWIRHTGSHSEIVKLRVSGTLVTQTVIRDGVAQGEKVFKYDARDMVNRRYQLKASGYRKM